MSEDKLMSEYRKVGSVLIKLQAMLVCCLVAGAASAAVMTPGYTKGLTSQLSTDNGGAGSILFEDSAATGGGDTTLPVGSAVWLTTLVDGAGQWRIGDTVQITGVALPISGYTDSGTMTFDIRQGSGGIGDSGAGGLASIGSASATYSKTNTSALYVNFDDAISFVVDTNTFKIGINISNTARLRVKTQNNFPVPLYNTTSGVLGSSKMNFSVAGNVSAAPITTNSAPEFSSDPFSKGKAYTDTPFSDTLSDVVSDADNDQPDYSVLSFSGPGADWLGIDGSSITGTPQTVNIGTNEWVVQAADAYGGTNTATMTIIVESSTGNMIPSYSVGSGQLRPNGETLFVDTAAVGGSININDATGFKSYYTVLIPGSNYWEIGDTVGITGFALALRSTTANGTMSFEIREAAGGTGVNGLFGLSAIGTNTATFTWNGATDTYYANFDTPFSFVADANTTSIGINIRNSGNLALKADNSFPVTRYNYANGNLVSSGMKVSVAGNVIVPDEKKYGLWETEYGVTNGPTGDDDLDGLANLYEYGLGGNPTNGFVDGNIPTFGPEAGGLEYVYAQRTDDSTLVYYLDLTPSLTPPVWTNLGYTVSGTNVTGGTFDFVTNVIDTADDVKFIDLQIEQTP
jgi:hypothetical protein